MPFHLLVGWQPNQQCQSTEGKEENNNSINSNNNDDDNKTK